MVPTFNIVDVESHMCGLVAARRAQLLSLDRRLSHRPSSGMLVQMKEVQVLGHTGLLGKGRMDSNCRAILLQHARLVIVTSLLIALAMSSASSVTAQEAPTVYATRFIRSGVSKFGLGIEGASVDPSGKMFATDYSDGTGSGLGSIASPDGVVLQKLLFKDQTGSKSFNGIRFLPISKNLSTQFGLRAIATDVLGHQVVHFLQWNVDQRVRAFTLCGNETMKQPNDLAVATRSGRVYLSGGDYGKLTTEVGDGDLWVCETPSSFLNSTIDQLQPVTAKRLGGFGLTNGVEVSPDEKTLYLSEAFHTDGEVVNNLIWKFAIDPSTGDVFNKTLLVDFNELDGSGSVYVDGIRTDTDGNLFVVRNGAVGEVVKLSPDGKLLLRIRTPGLLENTNCDFGGPNGTSLFVLGKCSDEPEKGCVDVWEGNPSPGRAWAELTTNQYED